MKYGIGKSSGRGKDSVKIGTVEHGTSELSSAKNRIRGATAKIHLHVKNQRKHGAGLAQKREHKRAQAAQRAQHVQQIQNRAPCSHTARDTQGQTVHKREHECAQAAQRAQHAQEIQIRNPGSHTARDT